MPGRRLERLVRAWLPIGTPLRLTRYSVVVPVHFHVRAVLKKVLRFSARGHLRAIGSPVATKRSVCGLRSGSALGGVCNIRSAFRVTRAAAWRFKGDGGCGRRRCRQCGGPLKLGIERDNQDDRKGQPQAIHEFHRSLTCRALTVKLNDRAHEKNARCAHTIIPARTARLFSFHGRSSDC